MTKKLTFGERMELDLPPYAAEAFKGSLVPGCMLPTKDGRRMGNAHIIGMTITESRKVYFHVITDSGNEMKLSVAEIWELFHMPPYIADVQEVINKFRR